jgi:hypothetical protein
MDNGLANKKLLETLLEGLRQALAEPGEVRLYKSGKLAGLFAGKSAVNGDAAAWALRDGFLEILRTETKGKTTIEWVRLTPAGVRFLHDRESPIKALEELKTALLSTKDGIPLWLADMRARLEAIERSLHEDAQRFSNQLQALSERVESGLKRMHALAPEVAPSIQADYPWALEAIQYLDQRHAAGKTSPCPLPELFADLASRHADLALGGFHAGLRVLHDRRLLRLKTVEGDEPLPQPEFALLDGTSVLYFAER